MRRAILILSLALATTTAMAEPLEDPAQEARAEALFHELRCLVCQNQSIAESNAPLAQDLRSLVREHVAKGDSEAEIKGYLVARYGEFVLLRPRFSAHTWLLWGMPVLVLLAGAALSARAFLRRGGLSPAAPEPLSVEEQRQLEGLTRPDAAQ